LLAKNSVKKKKNPQREWCTRQSATAHFRGIFSVRKIRARRNHFEPVERLTIADIKSNFRTIPARGMRKIVLAAVGFPSQPSAYFTSTTDATAPLKYSKRKVALHLCVLADFPLFSVFSFLYYSNAAFHVQCPKIPTGCSQRRWGD